MNRQCTTNGPKEREREEKSKTEIARFKFSTVNQIKKTVKRQFFRYTFPIYRFVHVSFVINSELKPMQLIAEIHKCLLDTLLCSC